jgi:hypothetical protein
MALRKSGRIGLQLHVRCKMKALGSGTKMRNTPWPARNEDFRSYSLYNRFRYMNRPPSIYPRKGGRFDSSLGYMPRMNKDTSGEKQHRTWRTHR